MSSRPGGFKICSLVCVADSQQAAPRESGECDAGRKSFLRIDNISFLVLFLDVSFILRKRVSNKHNADPYD